MDQTAWKPPRTLNNNPTMRTSYVVGDKTITVPWGEHGPILAQFRDYLKSFRFCRPVLPVPEEFPLVVVSDHAQAAQYRSDRWSALINRMRVDLMMKAENDVHYVKNSGRPGGLAVMSDFMREIERIINSYTQSVAAMTPALHPRDTVISADGLLTTESHLFQLRECLQLVLYTLMTTGSAPSLGWSFYQVLRRGYIPLRWMGPWPSGYCVAYCPAGAPQAIVPPECVPTAEQFAAGKATPSDKPKRQAATRRADLSVVPTSSWRARCAAPDRAAAFREHFALLAQTDACRALLTRISGQVRGLRIDGQDLVIEFPERVIERERGDRDVTPSRLRCMAPYSGPAAALPVSVEAVLRLHNGMRGEEALAPLEWFVFDGTRFMLEWSLWWRADSEDPEELFAEPPQIPLTDGNDIWLLHPTISMSSGEPALVRMSHETALLSGPLGFGAGGAFLRLLALQLGLDGCDGLLDEVRGD